MTLLSTTAEQIYVQYHLNFLDIRWNRLILKSVFLKNIPIQGIYFKLSISNWKATSIYIFLPSVLSGTFGLLRLFNCFLGPNQAQNCLIQEKNLSFFFIFLFEWVTFLFLVSSLVFIGVPHLFIIILPDLFNSLGTLFCNNVISNRAWPSEAFDILIFLLRIFLGCFLRVFFIIIIILFVTHMCYCHDTRIKEDGRTELHSLKLYVKGFIHKSFYCVMFFNNLFFSNPSYISMYLSLNKSSL